MKVSRQHVLLVSICWVGVHLYELAAATLVGGVAWSWDHIEAQRIEYKLCDMTHNILGCGASAFKCVHYSSCLCVLQHP
jgi:hypothetical protein